MSMWRPPERIRHDAQPGRWPTAAEAARSALFQPIRVGAHELGQRTWVPAMVPWRATEDGFVTPNVLAWYERFIPQTTFLCSSTGYAPGMSAPRQRCLRCHAWFLAVR